jgi:L-threonylcarbamoyladenylate synthase
MARTSKQAVMSGSLLEKVVTIDPAFPEQSFSRCREVISAGGIIVYPTDTYYGLGADPRNCTAVKRLFDIKDRQRDQPIILLMADASEICDWAAEITPQAEILIKRYWPGPLTLVFKARVNVLTHVTANTGTIGLRVPGNALTRSLLRYLGHALTGTSANISTKKSPKTAQEAATIAGLVDLILDGGKTAGEKPSTIIDVRTELPHVIREGAIPSRSITDLHKIFPS